MGEASYPQAGEAAPQFQLKDASENPVSLDQFKGKWVVLYFYPKDDTPGCTTEAIEFTASLPEFDRYNAVILGVSPDTCASHQKFMKKHGLKVQLLSDPEKKMLETYGVWQKKSRYGREYMGVVRTTFLIDPEGKIRHIWPNVKVNGHVQEVLERLAENKA